MRSRRGKSTRVRDALESVLGGMESATRIRENMALVYWDDVVGPQAAAASQPENVREGALFIRTKSSVWSHELTLLKSQIIPELNRRIGRPVIRDLIFRAQGVRHTQPEESEAGPTAEELDAVVLPADERDSLQREVRDLGGMPDEEMRAALVRHMILDRKLRRWRLDHGWRPCAECGCLHETPDSICPFCRVCR